ncbi:MAG TPA: ABC transporter permease [Rudaea sp.]|nr:ABC transporter permease [Rudaea sp.]
MMGFAAFLLSLREIQRNLMRSFLTILGIVIGVAAVITMVTLGNGATKAVSDQISSLGSNLLIVRPGQRFGAGHGSAPPFRSADVRAINDQIGSLQAVAPTVQRSITVVRLANNWTTSIGGSTNAYFTARQWQPATGRVFTDSEERAGKAVCVIGATVRRELFGNENPIGGRIRIKQFSCEVIGLLAPKGQAAMGQDQDDTIMMPLRTVQRRLMGTQDVNALMISVADGASIDRAKSQIEILMRERRRISQNEDDNFNVMDTRQIAEALSSTTRVMTVLLGAVAAVSLLVGGIGIMNIMLVSVTERTREIGIRLAVGALEREVLLQFLIEAVVLSSLGGLIGVAIATVGSYAAAGAMQVPFLFNTQINLLAFVFSAAIGVIFGFFPARRAARLDPIEALRHE